MNDRSIVPPCGFLPQRTESSFTFIAHQGFYTQILAYMLDSLVRVSRRVNENHFVKIAKTRSLLSPVLRVAPFITLLCWTLRGAGAGLAALRRVLSFPQAVPW